MRCGQMEKSITLISLSLGVRRRLLGALPPLEISLPVLTCGTHIRRPTSPKNHITMMCILEADYKRLVLTSRTSIGRMQAVHKSGAHFERSLSATRSMLFFFVVIQSHPPHLRKRKKE